MVDAALRKAPRLLADLLLLGPHHLRSIQIERDYADPTSSAHYVVTPFVEKTFGRLSQSLNASTTARAWRLTGDYGSGKSSFALAFARYAGGASDALPAQLKRVSGGIRLEPVLVVGEREPIAQSVLRALRTTLARQPNRQPKALVRALAIADNLEPQAVIAALELANSTVRQFGRADGLLVILDELGKNLEYAASAPDHGDLHLLQHLAEAAARSGEAPLVVLAILHQAVTAYAQDLSTSERREWEKVSGRYEEIVFAPPLEQTAVLIAAALDVDQKGLPRGLAAQARAQMAKVVGAGWYGAGASEAELVALAPALAPLDPMVLPVLARTLRRFGQNERSLFSFLSSAEPSGLMAHARQELSAFQPYRLHDLYDYLSSNLSGALENGSAGTRWGVIDAVVRSAVTHSDLERAALKTVGVINLLDDPGLVLTPELLSLALVGIHGDHDAAMAGVSRLTTSARVLYERGAGGALCLWPHTSVDLEAAFEAALVAVERSEDLITALRPVLPTEPLVARRHYVETGTLRHFGVAYCQVSDLTEALALDAGPAADGRVVVVLSKNEREHTEALDGLATFVGWRDTLLVGVPPPVGSLAPLLRDVRAWRWVVDQTPALSGDRMAREEVSRQIALADDRLRRALSALLDLKGGGALTTSWFHRGESLDVRNGRQLTEALSAICDLAYARSPKIRNELLNRRQLSSAAARARTLLIEGLAQRSELPKLGLDETHTPPEMAIYLSVLQAGNVHLERDGRWRIETPSQDLLRLKPSLDRIAEVLSREEDRRVPYEEIAHALRSAPYGVRDGLVPLLVAIYLAIHWHHTAVYEEGTYLEQVGGPEFTRMLKESEHFAIQHCAVEGVRTEVFARLAVVLGLEAKASEPDLLDVVRPLLQFVARLPDHARRTRNLSFTTAAVRSVLLRVQDPSALLFQDLPKACGLEPFTAGEALDEERLEAFVGAMASAVRELRNAYPALLDRLTDALGHSLESTGGLESLHATLSRRAEKLMLGIVEPELKAFALRLADRGLTAKAWLESVASFLARKPPERWAEPDEREFHHRLKLLARRFIRVQATLGDQAEHLDVVAGEGAYRLVVTSADGRELEDLVRGRIDGAELQSLEAQFAALLSKNGRAGLLAAARALVAMAQTKDGPVGD